MNNSPGFFFLGGAKKSVDFFAILGDLLKPSGGTTLLGFFCEELQQQVGLGLKALLRYLDLYRWVSRETVVGGGGRFASDQEGLFSWKNGFGFRITYCGE